MSDDLELAEHTIDTALALIDRLQSENKQLRAALASTINPPIAVKALRPENFCPPAQRISRTHRALFVENMRIKLASMEEELIDCKYTVELANAENAELRAEVKRLKREDKE